jgi:1-acyl-sn-glycerol-3-phosphate acyltransferase
MSDKYKSPGARVWYYCARMSLQLLAITLFRFRAFGLNRPVTEGPLIVASNHQSHLDPPLLGCAYPRRLGYVARESLFKFKPLGLLIGSLGAFPLKRDSSIAGFKESLRRLKAGEALMAFPEGTRTPDGEIKSFKGGVARLAKRSRATIHPAAIEGAFACWPKNQPGPHPGTVFVMYAEPIPPEEVASMDEAALGAEVERRIRAAHAELKSHPAFRRRRHL